jgi:serine phosphatase RsbU (regulator of sigma subunit)
LSLIQKFFIFLALAIVLPLAVAVHLIASNSRTISAGVTSAIHALETEFAENITTAAGNLVDTSFLEIDKLTQHNWERLTFYLSNKVADFLYDRDDDIRFLARVLSTHDQPEALIENFRQTKTRLLTVNPEFRYDKIKQDWVTVDEQVSSTKPPDDSHDNIPYFRQRRPMPIYREISILDLDGNEVAKSSNLSSSKSNVKDRNNTFSQSESYFRHLKTLKPGEIYVSDVIGTYQPSLDNTENNGKNSADTPKPKIFRFEGIIRFATPLVEQNTISGYVTIALDHRHIMEFTNYIVPENNNVILSEDGAIRRSETTEGNIENARRGNYAVMWDSNGNNIAHPEESYISGFDPANGKRVEPLLSAEQAEILSQSEETDFTTWLRHWGASDTPPEQNKIDETNAPSLPFHCRYLDFIPQCQDGQQTSDNSGYRSFLIDQSDGLKLTTVATIPYYIAGDAKNRQGFGYITININLREFTRLNNNTDDALNYSFGKVNTSISSSLRQLGQDTGAVLGRFQGQLIFVGISMLALVTTVTMFASINISRRVQFLLTKAAEFTTGNLSARVTGNRKDELGRIGQSFNVMANTIETSQAELASINANLERMVAQRTDELRESNQRISDSIDYASRIQRSMLPNNTAIKAILGDTAIIWHPKDVVGGDFYWHDTIGNRDYLVVMDCTGHGVPGAFMTLIATSTLEHIVSVVKADLGRRNIGPDLNLLMQNLHDGICDQLNQVGGGSESNDGLDAIILAIPHDGSAIEYCGAQMDIFTVTEDKTITRHQGTKKSLGYFNDGVPLNLEVHKLPNDPGTSFVITTDGITTQVGEEKHYCFGYKRLMANLKQAKDNSPKTLNRAIMRAFGAWQGAEVQRDDVTVVSFKPSHKKSRPSQYHDVLI